MCDRISGHCSSCATAWARCRSQQETHSVRKRGRFSVLLVGIVGIEGMNFGTFRRRNIFRELFDCLLTYQPEWKELQHLRSNAPSCQDLYLPQRYEWRCLSPNPRESEISISDLNLPQIRFPLLLSLRRRRGVLCMEERTTAAD